MKVNVRGAILAAAMIGTPVALASPAMATVSIVSETPPTTPFTLPEGAKLLNFNGMTPGSFTDTTVDGVGIDFQPDSKVVQGSLSGQYAAPYVYDGNGVPFGDSDGVDTTPYLTTGVGSITLTFDHAVKNLGLLWGSVDAYNTLQFYNNNVLVGAFTGAEILTPSNGDQGVNGSVYVQMVSDALFNQVRFSSTQNAFEFDNVAVGAPEPASWALVLGAGLMGFFFIKREKHSKRDAFLRSQATPA